METAMRVIIIPGFKYHYLGRPLTCLIFSLMASIRDPIY